MIDTLNGMLDTTIVLHAKVYVLLVALIVAIFLGRILVKMLRNKFKDQASELDYFKKTYLYRRGIYVRSKKKFEYRILSTNGGRDWYATDSNETILGKVKDVYPGLLKRVGTLRWDIPSND